MSLIKLVKFVHLPIHSNFHIERYSTSIAITRCSMSLSIFLSYLKRKVLFPFCHSYKSHISVAPTFHKASSKSNFNRVSLWSNLAQNLSLSLVVNGLLNKSSMRCLCQHYFLYKTLSELKFKRKVR